MVFSILMKLIALIILLLYTFNPQFVYPAALTSISGDFASSKMGDIVSQAGRIDITDRVNKEFDQGILTIRINPAGTFLYVLYVSGSDILDERTQSKIIVSRFPITNGSLGNEQIVFDRAWTQYITHIGGGLAFESNDVMFVALGDGSPGGNWAIGAYDFRERAQNIDSFNGKILRMNAHTGSPMPDNPYYMAGSMAAQYVYAIGLRQPLRMENINGTIYIADVGDATYEEINILQRGANYGWPYMEGPKPHISGITNTKSITFTTPFTYYAHAGIGAAITGIALWNNELWSADYARRQLRNWTTGKILTTTVSPTDLQVNVDGCLYYTGFNGPESGWEGRVEKICDANIESPLNPPGTPISSTVTLTVIGWEVDANRIVDWDVSLIHDNHLHPNWQTGHGISITLTSPTDHGNGLRACAELVCVDVIKLSSKLYFPHLIRE